MGSVWEYHLRCAVVALPDCLMLPSSFLWKPAAAVSFLVLDLFLLLVLLLLASFS
jgi:hypothetical protein